MQVLVADRLLKDDEARAREPVEDVRAGREVVIAVVLPRLGTSERSTMRACVAGMAPQYSSYVAAKSLSKRSTSRRRRSASHLDRSGWSRWSPIGASADPQGRRAWVV